MDTANAFSSPKIQPATSSVDYPSFLTPLATGRYVMDKGGRAVFAAAPIKEGDVVAVFGGQIVGLKEVLVLTPLERSRVLQIAERWFLHSTQECPSDWINHSCDPNCGFRDEVTLIAMKDIEEGEETTFDYAMADSVEYDEFTCECGAGNCRRAVRSTDWQLRTLKERYGAFFSPYLRR